MTLFAIMMLCALPLIAEDAMAVKDLPAAVQEALHKNFAGAQVAKIERNDKRNDYVYYTVTLREKEEERQVTINENGEISPP
jgi:hypothetical protein